MKFYYSIFWVYERTTSKRKGRKTSYLPKISISGQFVFEIFAQLCSDDSIQILLKLTQFITLQTESNLEGFVWSHQSESKMGLVSLRQFALQCKFLKKYPNECHYFKNLNFYDITLELSKGLW